MNDLFDKMNTDYWYTSHWLHLFLWPLSSIFSGAVQLRRFLYRKNIKKTVHFSVPIIVVGNITVGGTGKTPMVIWLAKKLKDRGFYPGIISRGYRGSAAKYPQVVDVTSLPDQVGDEPVLMSHHLDCPIVVCTDRVLAAQFLLDRYYCNILLSDDGLQHYRLGRTIEIAMVDADRVFGNGYCLPIGPLREPISRLKTVDFMVYTNGQFAIQEEKSFFNMRLCPGLLTSVVDPAQKKEVIDCVDQPIHAVSGIGNANRFFYLLRQLGFTSIEEHPFRDHYAFKVSDIDFRGRVVMTEKDAMKCKDFADDRHWFLPVTAQVNDQLVDQILDRIQ